MLYYIRLMRVYQRFYREDYTGATLTHVFIMLELGQRDGDHS